jgi:hypothetical protein
MKLETVQALFPTATEKRGKVWLDEMDVARIIDGVPISFDCRRYSNCTFTWAHFYIGGQWVWCGDPWQVLVPSTKALVEEINRRKPQAVYSEVQP